MQTEVLRVTGMTCGGCTSSVTRALKAAPGVSEVTVSLATGEAVVRYDGRLTSPDQLRSAVTHAGYRVDGAQAGHHPAATHGCCG